MRERVLNCFSRSSWTLKSNFFLVGIGDVAAEAVGVGVGVLTLRLCGDGDLSKEVEAKLPATRDLIGVVGR